MSMQIASLFASIGADTSGLDRGLQNAKKGITGLSSDIKSAPKINLAMMVTGVNQAVQLAGQVAQALKGVYDFAKEGAVLQASAGKFDNLAKSIGAVSDALLDDLRSATRGMVSDADLMASAADFMALGFAKNTDEVVRLTNVAGALGMNMNQLVLTLANQTTMRFDQLGVSVDGFEEKVESLKATGMSASDAFQEAFLQQAEEQIQRVGDVSETSAGKIMMMESSFKNMGDSIKANVADAVAPSLGDLSEAIGALTLDSSGLGSAFGDAAETITMTALQVVLAQTAFKNFNNIDFGDFMHAMSLVVGITTDGEVTAADMKAAIRSLGGSIGETAQEIFSGAASFDQYTSDMTEAGYALVFLNEQEFLNAKAYHESAAGTQALAGSMTYLGDAATDAGSRVGAVSYESARGQIAETKLVVDDLALAYMNLEAAKLGFQSDIVSKVKLELDQEFNSNKITVDEYMSALETMDSQFGTSYSMQFKLEGEIDELVKDLLENPESFKENVISVAADYSELDQATRDAIQLVEDLQAKLDGIRGSYTANVTVKISAPPGYYAPDNWVDPIEEAVGGPAYTNSPYIVGERGPELFVPQGSGYIMTNAQTANALDGGVGSGLLGDILFELQSQPARIKVAVKEAMALVGG